MTSVTELEKEITLVIAPEDDGRMVKQIAATRMGLSHKQFTSAKFRDNGVTLDGEKAFATQTVHTGQVLIVRLREPGQRSPEVAKPVDIVYEDDDLWVINKPAPLPTQSSERQTGDTLEARMNHLCTGGRVFRPVNRLDKGTSGLMIAAKHAQAQAILQSQLHSPSFIREYLAVAAGRFDQTEGIIDAPIKKGDSATIRRVVCENGKPSRTRYRIVGQDDSLSLVALHLDTGRTHQIRVHLSHIGHPVFGDFLYGTESPLLPGRFALHSAFVSFEQPLTKQRISLHAPMPGELSTLLHFPIPEEIFPIVLY